MSFICKNLEVIYMNEKTKILKENLKKILIKTWRY
jgi:hypothetical protein